ncbi:hypothetical protein [Parasitella parasitica]|uniref:Protein N-terminal glutamine amidohydrolase n=1 Tax=Parasitella parasitica TaxID=35722 RepID=A0A0B7NPT8_9FUNG|nr:hypothetical protein [Parasitella parasitica]
MHKDDDDQYLDNNVEELIVERDILKFNKSMLKYTPCYCEENIYMLCLEIAKRRPEVLGDFSVMFISNNNRSVPLWQQKAGRGDEHVVLWDYHVVLYSKQDSKAMIYDFDSLLPFPSPADFYAFETFKPNVVVKDVFRHSFRFIPAKAYLDHFSSDRRHMVRTCFMKRNALLSDALACHGSWMKVVNISLRHLHIPLF